MAELIPTKELLRRNVAKTAAKTVLSDEEKKAVRAGASRAWYADLPGSVADISGATLDYGAEGLARLLPSDLAGYDIPKSLGIRKFQQAMRNPALGSKQLEKFGEQVGYIPPTTGTETEERARLLAGFVDPVPGVPIGSVKQTKVFSSPAVKAVSEIKQNKMPANQWISQMKSRGVKQDEMTWTGVEDWLKSQDKSVTKQDLDEYLEANQIQVQEVVKGTADPKAKELVINNEIADELTSIMDNDEGLYYMRDEIVPFIDKYRSGDETVVNDLDQYFMEYGDLDTGELAIPVLRNKYEHYFEQNPREFERLAGGETKYSQYTLPGGENYRELLLTLPSRRPLITKDPGGRYEELMDISARRDLTDAEQAEMVAIERQQFNQESGTVGTDFVSGHYDDPNIIAHIRFNERVDADGNKVLFIEEIQSDWAQKGRKSGFSNRDVSKEIEVFNQEMDRLNKQIDANDSKYRNLEMSQEERDALYIPLKEKYDEIIEKRAELVKIRSAVPSAPFVMDTNQWTSLALKRMVRWATDNDFDQIAWTTGKQQAKRYDLSKQVNEVSAMKNKDGTYQLAAEDKRGHDIFGYSGKKVTAEEMADNIGKEVAEKLIKGADSVEGKPWPSGKGHNPAFFRLFPEELEVGGEGMGAFYDKILVDRAKKLGKQYGSKVEMSTLGSKLRPVYGPPGVWHIYDPSMEDYWINPETSRIPSFSSKEEADSLIKKTKGFDKVWTMNLTDKLKKAAKDGLPYYVALPPIVAGVASQQADASEVKKPAVQVKSNRIMEEAMP